MKEMVSKLQSHRLIAVLLIAVMAIQMIGCGGGTIAVNQNQHQEMPVMSKEELEAIAPLPEDWQKADFILLEDGRARLPNGTVATNLSSLFKYEQISRSQDGSYHILKTNFLIPIKNATANLGLHDGWLWGYNAYDIGTNGNGHTFPIDDQGNTITTPHWNFAIYRNYRDMYQDQYVEETNRRSLINIHYGKESPSGCWFYSIAVYSSSDPLNRKRIWIRGKTGIACNDPSAKELSDEMSQELIAAMQIAGYVLIFLLAIELMKAMLIPAIALAENPPDGGDNIAPPPNEGGGPPDFPDISPDNNGGDGDDNDGDQNDDEDNNDYQGGPPDFPDIPPDNPGGNDGDDDQNDQTPPVVVRENSRVEFFGNDRFKLEVKFADLGDHPSGFNSAYLQLQDPSYQFHGIGGRNDSNPVILEVSMTGRDVGVWKVFAWAKDNAGNDSALEDTGLRIAWGAPWIEDQSMEGPSNTGQSVYRVKFDSLSGHAGIAWSELFYWIGERYYRIGNRINGWQAEWVINPLDYPNLEKGKAYPLTLIVEGTNGVKADMIPAGFYLTVPTVVIPPERGKESLVKYEPAGVPWWWENKYLAVTGWHGPYGPNNFNVNLTIYVEGTQHSRSTEHCPTVYGYRGNNNSYKVMGAWGYGYWMRFYGNVADLPTGLHSIGAEMRLDGRITGPLRAKDSWLWVDNDHPKFDQIIEGPTNGSIIRKSQSTELCIRTTMQDPGGSGTAEYWLALVGQNQERGFKERIYGYTGINHCNLAGLPNGQYGLYTTYSKDKVDNVQTRSLPTGVVFEITD